MGRGLLVIAVVGGVLAHAQEDVYQHYMENQQQQMPAQPR
jgi:hypothetical protein